MTFIFIPHHRPANADNGHFSKLRYTSEPFQVKRVRSILFLVEYSGSPHDRPIMHVLYYDFDSSKLLFRRESSPQEDLLAPTETTCIPYDERFKIVKFVTSRYRSMLLRGVQAI